MQPRVLLAALLVFATFAVYRRPLGHDFVLVLALARASGGVGLLREGRLDEAIRAYRSAAVSR